jgi:hydrogenase expression/formation protein HypE
MKDTDRILLAHGGGGEMTAQLVQEVILDGLGDACVGSLDDSVVLDLAAAPERATKGKASAPKATMPRIAFTTDSFVVKPLFFPGGDIGRLAVCGTVNDLSMRGARPIALSLAFILEEGLEVSVLRRVVESVAEAAHEANVKIATGDTKVVERGSADGLFINTAGVGIVPDGVEVSLGGARPGDEIIISGPIGNHAIAVLAQREGLAFETVVRSDAAPLNRQTSALVAKLGKSLHAMNDPTRSGLAMSLNTIGCASAVAIEIDETAVPVDSAVAFAAEMLGLDVFTLANEGKLVAFVAKGTAKDAISVLAAEGAHPALIGRAKEGKGVSLITTGGGRRILEAPYGEEAPRIC